MERSVGDSKAEIARLAYLLWEKAGRPPGRDLEFWLEAERQLFGQPLTAQPPRAAAAPPAPMSAPRTAPDLPPSAPKTGETMTRRETEQPRVEADKAPAANKPPAAISAAPAVVAGPRPTPAAPKPPGLNTPSALAGNLKPRKKTKK